MFREPSRVQKRKHVMPLHRPGFPLHFPVENNHHHSNGQLHRLQPHNLPLSHTHTPSLTHTHTPPHPPPDHPPPSHTPPLPLTHTHTPSLTHTHTPSLTHTHTHTLPLS